MMRRVSGPTCSSWTCARGGGSDVRRCLRPLDEDDGAVEVRLEVAPLGCREPAEPVEVEVRDVDDAGVPVADRERRARHAGGHPERARRAADEGRLPGAELPREQNDVARFELARKARRKSLGLLHRAALDLERRHPLFRTARAAPVGGRARRARRLPPPDASASRRPARGLVSRSEELRQPREIALEHLEHRRGVERRRRVEERIEGHGPPAERHRLLLAVHARDPERAAREERGGEAAERRHDARADELELPVEIGLARRGLRGQRVAVPGRPALEDRRQVRVVQRQPDGGEEAREELAGASGERRPLAILVEAGRLADEHELRVEASFAEDDVRAPLGERAADTARRLGRDGRQRRCALRSVHG